MAKRRVEFIQDDKKRKTTYKKRSANIMNKLTEITTLCGVEACAIINSPYHEGPKIWPPTHEAVHGVLRRLKNLPESLQTVHSVTPVDMIQKQIRKVRDQLLQQERYNRAEEIRAAISYMLQHGSGLLYQMSMEDFGDIVLMLNEMEKEVDEALSKLGQGKEVVNGGDANAGNVMRIGAVNPVNMLGCTGATNLGNLLRTHEAVASNPGSRVANPGLHPMWLTGAANLGNNYAMWNGAASAGNIMGRSGAANPGHAADENGAKDLLDINKSLKP